MKKAILFAIIMMVALIGCAQNQAAQTDNTHTEDEQAHNQQAKVTEKIDEPAQKAAKQQPDESTEEAASEAELEQAEQEDEPKSAMTYDYEPYSQIGCENLLTAEEFANACNQAVENLKVTYKVGTSNCYVNINHIDESRLTAGITLLTEDTPEEALEEFDRRLKVFNVGADKSVGEKAYEFPKANRQTVNFLRGKYIVEVGSDERLCPVDSLLNVAKTADAKLNS